MAKAKKAAKAPRKAAAKAKQSPPKSKPAAKPRKAAVKPKPQTEKPRRESAAERLIRERKEAFARGVARPDITGEKQGATDHLKATQFKPGQSGNPAGRPKGARNKLGELFLEDLMEAWQANGKVALEQAMFESPIGFVKVVGSVVPKEFHHKLGDFDDVDDEDLDALIDQGLAVLGRAAAGGKGAQGEGDTGGAQQA